jgi:hypothetical protein
VHAEFSYTEYPCQKFLWIALYMVQSVALVMALGLQISP